MALGIFIIGSPIYPIFYLLKGDYSLSLQTKDLSRGHVKTHVYREQFLAYAFSTVSWLRHHKIHVADIGPMNLGIKSLDSQQPRLAFYDLEGWRQKKAKKDPDLWKGLWALMANHVPDAKPKCRQIFEAHRGNWAGMFQALPQRSRKKTHVWQGFGFTFDYRV